MKPSLGWTFWSRADLRRIDKQLKADAQEVRDELGFLLLHQAFANGFFPGTSVLQTRLRYVLSSLGFIGRFARGNADAVLGLIPLNK